jgi:hypothetical protein
LRKGRGMEIKKVTRIINCSEISYQKIHLYRWSN